MILVDATHKANNLDFPFYAIVVIDGNGETEIVAVMLVAQEDEQSIKKMFQIFKARNDKWSDIQVVMTNKDMTERNVITSEIPNAKLQICLYHVQHTFGCEVTRDKMVITVLEVIQQMSHAPSEAVFMENMKNSKALVWI